MVRWIRGGYKIVGLVGVVVLVASACSKSSPSSTPSSAPALPIYDVSGQGFGFVGMPSSIPAGNMVINFSNKESFPIAHEMIVKAMPSGKTVQDVIESAKVPGCEGGAECESQYLAFGEVAGVDTGATLSGVFSLPAGQYFFACWETGTQSGGTDGPTHAAVGMVFPFTVT